MGGIAPKYANGHTCVRSTFRGKPCCSGSVAKYNALAKAQMNRSPWGRGYKRHTWRMDASGAYVDVVQTQTPAPALADFLDSLLCGGGISRTALDAATQPSRLYPYPSGSPLCP